jgi:hypothetical protein
MSAMAFTRVIDVEEGLGGIPLTMGATPLVYYYGYGTPMEKGKLYGRLIKTMAGVVKRKCEEDVEGRLQFVSNCILCMGLIISNM